MLLNCGVGEDFESPLACKGASPVAQTVKRLPAMPEIWVRSLGWEDPLEKEMADHSSTLALKIPWMEEPGRLQSMGSQRIWQGWATSVNCKRSNQSILGNQPWIFNGRTDAEAEAPILWPPDVKSQPHLKRPWCWERLKAGGEGHNRGWDDWMASPAQQTWVWASSGRWWRTGKPGMLQSAESQRVRHNWATEQQLKYITAIGVNYSNTFLKDSFCFSLEWL